jgi:hypothetical protein
MGVFSPWTPMFTTCLVLSGVVHGTSRLLLHRFCKDLVFAIHYDTAKQLLIVTNAFQNTTEKTEIKASEITQRQSDSNVLYWHDKQPFATINRGEWFNQHLFLFLIK